MYSSLNKKNWRVLVPMLYRFINVQRPFAVNIPFKHGSFFPTKENGNSRNCQWYVWNRQSQSNGRWLDGDKTSDNVLRFTAGELTWWEKHKKLRQENQTDSSHKKKLAHRQWTHHLTHVLQRTKKEWQYALLLKHIHYGWKKKGFQNFFWFYFAFYCWAKSILNSK